MTSLLLGCNEQDEKKIQAAEERAIAAEKRAVIAEEKLAKVEKQLEAIRKTQRDKFFESRHEKSDDIGW
ncbi:hypothetical protein [uncultured Bilophila sp.]|uniref:hypothetical protein n=1 Tax=uncultured Bilophila sp. TaxID=529385 RepID=UPI00266F6730|nr:hypothetical protein [uncultured Bilophila sp.]